jgi:hypothetical protein
MEKAFDQWAVENKLSIWLCALVLVFSTIMMHPTFSAFIAFLFELTTVVALRSVAHEEGKYLGKALYSEGEK